MREILFRAKGKGSGKWLYGYYARLSDAIGLKDVLYAPAKNPNESNHTYGIDPATVGQYTGLKDNNGKKIYEGDIIKSKQDGLIGVIRFGEYQTTNSENGECHLGFSIKWYGKYSDLLRKDLGWWINLKIIGNIYDNPELLKGEHNE